MRQFIWFWITVLLFYSCEDIDNAYNNGRFFYTSKSIESHEKFSRSTQALRVIGDEVWFLDGSRRALMGYDLKSGKSRFIQGLLSYEKSFGGGIWDDYWGMSLIVGEEGILIAGVDLALCLLDKHGELKGFVGQIDGIKARDGVRLSEVSFDGFNGIGYDVRHKRLFLSFDDVIYEVFWNGSDDLEHLGGGVLTRVVGGGSLKDIEFGKGKEAQLRLPIWQEMAILEDGSLFFQELSRFLLYKDGRVVYVTGDGEDVGGERMPLSLYSGYFVSSVNRLQYVGGKGLFFMIGRQSMLIKQVEIKSIDWEKGVVDGYISNVEFNSDRHFDDYWMEGGYLYLSSREKGGVWRMSLESGLSEVFVHGQESEGLQKLNENGLFMPREVVSLLDSAHFAVNEPLLQRISLVSKHYNQWVRSDLIQFSEGKGVSHLISDGRRRLYFLVGSSLYRFLVKYSGKLEFQKINDFLKREELYGIPNYSKYVKISENYSLYDVGDYILLRIGDKDNVAVWSVLSGQMEMEIYSWSHRSVLEGYDETLFLGSLDWGGVRDVIGNGVIRYMLYKGDKVGRKDGDAIFVGNRSFKESHLWGYQWKGMQYMIWGGWGNKDSCDGCYAHEVRFSSLLGMDFDSSKGGMWLTEFKEREGVLKLWHVDGDRKLSEVHHDCGVNFVMSKDSRIYYHERVGLVYVGEDIRVCRTDDKQVSVIGGKSIGRRWGSLGEVLGVKRGVVDVVVEGDRMVLVSLSDGERCMVSFVEGDYGCEHLGVEGSSQVLDLSLRIEGEIVWVYSVVREGDMVRVYRNGVGEKGLGECMLNCVGSEEVVDVRFSEWRSGLEVIGMGLDSLGRMYVLSHRGLWRLDSIGESSFNESSMVRRLSGFKALSGIGKIGSFSVSEFGEVFVGGKGGIYRFSEGEGWSYYGGGGDKVFEGSSMLLKEVDLGEIYDLVWREGLLCGVGVNGYFCSDGKRVWGIVDMKSIDARHCDGYMGASMLWSRKMGISRGGLVMSILECGGLYSLPL